MMTRPARKPAPNPLPAFSIDDPPPHDAAAEADLLASLLLEPHRLAEARTILPHPAAFYDTRNQAIYATILRLADRGALPDAPLVVREVPAEIEEYAIGLPERVVSGTNATYFARIVLDRAARRQAIHDGYDLARRATAGEEIPSTLVPALFHLSDLGNARRLVHRHGQNLRYVQEDQRWLAWDGARFHLDGARAEQLARTLPELIRAEADTLPEKEAQAAYQWAGKTESRSRLESALALARAEPQVAIRRAALDRDPDILAVPNGTVDLRTGALRPSDRAALCTRLAGIRYDPAATCPAWEDFLDRTFAADADLIGYAQRVAGYSLTGRTSEQVAFFLYGTGANGKALALDTPVPTPAGWTTQGALRPGDAVFDERGRPCRVVAVSPTWIDRPCYRLAFSDGTSVVADAAHEWPAKAPWGRIAARETRELAQGVVYRTRTRHGRPLREYRWSVAVAGALDLPPADLPIDPYVLGAWLGNGHSATSEITCHQDDVAGMAAQIAAAGYYPRPRRAPLTLGIATSPDAPRGPVDTFVGRLRALGVLNNKHVPAAYLRASVEQRLALLQGLMDTDGSTLRTQAQCEFSSTTRALADAVIELTRSLGLVPVLGEGRATLYGKDCGPKYRVLFTAPAGFDVFRLPRKRCRPRAHPPARRIVACEPVAPVPTRCIEVDAPSHLYLCTLAMIPTHNSTWLAGLRAILAEYAVQADFNAFALDRDPNHFGLARLAGARLVTCSEARPGAPIDEAALKQVTGGDRVCARAPYGDFFEFDPSLKLLVACNHEPTIRSQDEGTWRRLRVVPFTHTIPEAERRGTFFEDVLRPELPGILAWAVRGAQSWYQVGLGTTGTVAAATREYRDEMDLLAAFLAERCIVDPACIATASDLYATYRAWTEAQGERTWSQTAFGRGLRERGFTRIRHGAAGRIAWSGLGLNGPSGSRTVPGKPFGSQLVNDTGLIPSTEQSE